MQIEFTKMHGAGNDFILIDNRDGTFPVTDTHWLRRIAARHTGIGCDGIILVEPPSASVNFNMRFINPDGNEVDMCGNGARCVARYAYDRNIAPRSMVFDTPAGHVKAEILDGDSVAIGLSQVSSWERDLTISNLDGDFTGQWLNTGVPHAVFQVSDIDTFNVVDVGRQIRHDQHFQPGGTNVDFFECVEAGRLRVRTYERGVEGETLACGTGIAATALCACDLGLTTSPVQLTCQSGDTLSVSFDSGDLRSVVLTGPAAYVFEGAYRR